MFSSISLLLLQEADAPMKTTIQLRPKAVPNNLLHPDNEARYIIIDENSGAILDNNNGYGYKTVI